MNNDPRIFRPKALSDARLRLFAFPCAGMGAYMFRSWAELLPDWIELCSVQYPGRETRLREKSLMSVPDLVEDVVRGIRPYLDTPFIFLGHSLGALTAYETARALSLEKQSEPAMLIAAGREAPQIKDPMPPIRHLDDDRFVKELNDRYQAIPKALLDDRDLLAYYLPAIRSDFNCTETYAYREANPFDYPVFAYGGEDDHEVPCDSLDAWSKCTSSLFKTRMFSGGHFFINDFKQDVVRSLVADAEEMFTTVI